MTVSSGAVVNPHRMSPVHRLLIVILVALPWLNPFAPGPSPAFVPWLVALTAAAGLILPLSLYPDASGETTETGFPLPWWGYPVAWAWILSGVASSVLGLLQYFGASALFDPWVNQAPQGEAFANLRQRNQFASLISIALVALMWRGVTDLLCHRRRWLLWLAAGLLGAGSAASASRTGLLQLVLLCVLSWASDSWRQPLARRILLTAVLSYGLAMLVLPLLGGFELSGHGMFARLRTGETSCASRFVLWSNVLHLIAQKPWSGWGWGELDYAHYMTLYPGGRFCDILDNAHNLPLHLAVELGIPAALCVCAALGWIVWRTKPWRETDPARQMAWGVLAVIMLHSLLEYPLWYGPFQMTVGLCVGMLWVTPRERIPANPEGSLMGSVVRLTLASALLAAAAYAAWDYYRISQIYRVPEMRPPAYRGDTMSKIRGSWLFRNQVSFAELTTTPLKRDNAQWALDTATELLHFSPEPRVIEKVIESAVMVGRDDEALLHLVRYRAAFPGDYEKWRLVNRLVGAPVD